MHPVIAIVSTLVVLGFLARGGAAILIAVTGLLLLAYLGLQPALAGARRMLRQLRWLFLSILVLYLWFTPGEPLIPVLGALAPSQAGLAAGLERVLVLVLMVLTVNLLLVHYGPDALCGGIYWLLAPATRIGVPAERIALRLSLTLEAVTRVRDRIAAARGSAEARESGRLARIGAVAVSLYRSVLADARASPVTEREIGLLGRPPLWQWFIPVGLAAVMILFGGRL